MSCDNPQITLPPGVHEYLDLEFSRTEKRTLRLDLLVPARPAPPPLVMVIHGGGWREGSRKDKGYEWLGDFGLAIARVEYRLSHEAIFPAQLEDLQTALQWLRRQGATYGYNASRLAALGTSVGATLALLLGSQPDHGLRGVVAYCGPTDLLLRAESQPQHTHSPSGIVYQWLGGPVSERTTAARLASPAHQLGRHSPPLLCIQGSADLQVLPDQALALAQAAFKKHVPFTLVIVPDATHCDESLRTGTNRMTAARFLLDRLSVR